MIGLTLLLLNLNIVLNMNGNFYCVSLCLSVIHPNNIISVLGYPHMVATMFFINSYYLRTCDTFGSVTLIGVFMVMTLHGRLLRVIERSLIC